VASDVDASDDAIGLGGHFDIGATVKAGHDVSELKPLLQAEIDRIKKEGPSEAEVARAKRNFIASKVRQVERIAGRADILNKYETYLGDPGFLPRDIARYRAVTADSIKAFANKYLPDDKRLELTIVPAAKGPSASAK
jgi:zinc protease